MCTHEINRKRSRWSVIFADMSGTDQVSSKGIPRVRNIWFEIIPSGSSLTIKPSHRVENEIIERGHEQRSLSY